jgi:hypothetical protein
MGHPGNGDNDWLEPPAYLGRPRFEEPRTVSDRSIASVGLVALLGLIGAVAGFTAHEGAAALFGLGVFLIFGAGYALLLGRSVRQERELQRPRRKPR